MAKTMTTRDLVAKISKGDLKDVIKVLRDPDVEMNTNNAAKLFFSYYTACACRADQLVPSEFLFVVNRTIDYITEPTEDLIVNYYKTAFHIVKYLCKKINGTVIKSFKRILRPHFLKEPFSSVVRGLYENSLKNIYNAVVFICTETKEYADVVELATEYFKLCRPVVENVPYLINARNIVKCFTMTDLKAEECTDFYRHIVKTSNLDVFSKDLCVKFSNFIFKMIENCKLEDRSDFEILYLRCLQGVQMSQEYRCVLKLALFSLAIGPGSPKTKTSFKDIVESYRVLESSLDLANFSEVMVNFHVGLSSLLIYYQSNTDQWLTMDKNFKWVVLNNLFEMCPSNNTYLFSLCGFAILCLTYFTIKDRENLMEFKGMALKVLDRMEKVKYAKLAPKCENTMKHWDVQFKSILYKMALILQKYTDKSCIPFLETLLGHIFYFEECKDSCTYTKDSLLILAVNCLNFEEYEKCLQVCAVYFYFFMTSTRNLSICWAKCKHILGEKNNPHMTVCTILSSLNYLKMKGENFALSNLTRCKLLHIELKIYKEMWKSRTPMMAVLKELSSTVENIKMLVQIIIEIFSDCSFEVHENVGKIIQKTLKDYKVQINKKTRVEHRIDLIYLTFLNYQLNFRRHLALNTEEMEKSAAVQKEIDSNPKEKCEMIALYSRLKLDKYLTIIKDLNESMELISTLMDEDINKLKKYPTIYDFNIFDFLIKISHEFQLHLNSNKSIRAAVYALKIAEIQDNPQRIIEAISLIILKTDVSKPYITSLIAKADSLLQKVDTKDIILQYHISKCRAILYKDIKAAYEIYQRALKMLDEMESSRKRVYQMQLGLIRHKFIMLPCNVTPVDHNTHGIKDILDTLCHTPDFLENLTGNAFQMCVMFEIREEVLKTFKNLRSPRHVNGYARKPLELSQSMILPMRCLVFLSCISEMEILVGNYDTAQVKLNAMSDILCIPQGTRSESEFSAGDLTNLLKNLKLDVAVKNQFCLSPGSPICVENDFNAPECVKHRSDCDCFFCCSIEYQRLFLVKTMLDALLYLRKDDLVLARNYLQGGLSLYDYYKRNYSEFVEKTMKMHGNYLDLVLNCEDYFLEPYCELLHLLSKLLMNNGRKDDALEILSKILNFLYPRKEEYAQWFITIVLKKLGFMKEEKTREKEEFLNVQTSESTEHPVTPESKFSIPKQLPIETPVIIGEKRPPKTRRRLAIPDNDPVEKRNKSKSPIRTPEPKTPLLIPKIETEEPEYSNLKTRSKSECSIAPDLRRKTRLLTQKLRKNAEKNDDTPLNPPRRTKSDR